MQHTSLIHVIDARTFETEEILHMPAFSSPVPARSAPMSPRRYGAVPVPAPVSPSVSATHHHPSAQATAHIMRTLEDTFRIASATGGAHGDADVLVIPPLGDRAVDREVRRMLGHPGFRIEEADNEDGRGDQMDVDADGDRERDGDVARAHRHPYVRGYAEQDGEEDREDDEDDGCVGAASRRENAEAEVETERNLAGACFDPSGAFIYVASDAGVAEWGVRGAEKRWWVDGAWER